MSLLLVLQLFAAVPMPDPPPPPAIFRAVQQGPSILPAHRRGPHEGEPGAICYPGETHAIGQGRTLYHCECKLLCEVGAGGEPVEREDDDCVTACGTNQCSCHAEEACPMPEDHK